MPNGLFNLKQVNAAIQQGAWSNQKPQSVDYLVVAGGGGGGYISAAGAGGLLLGSTPVVAGSALTVTVGGGGTGRSAGGGLSTNGQNSVFSSISATGGGAGVYNNDGSGASGGSGSSNGVNALGNPGQGVAGQGNAGGVSVNAGGAYYGAGGGGAGTTGVNGFNGACGNGGAGIASAISGTITAYAGGGGGGHAYGANPGAGGAGGGGAGGGAANATSGTANTGGGGGATSYTGQYWDAGNGGSGIVIISYPDTYAAATSTTGSPTVSTSGSGSINFASAGYLTTGTGTAPSQAGDFTLECWLNLSTFNQSSGYALCGGTSSGANYWGFKNSNTMALATSSTGSETTFACTIPSTNTWFHYCLMRSGSTVYAFLNGVLQSSGSWSGSLFAAGSLYVGGYSSTYFCPGYMSNFRVTNTAVYSTSGFTPPTAPLTKITGTAILMNTVSGAYTADATGTWSFTNAYTAPTWSAASPFTVTGYKNRVYTWTSSGSITF